MDRQFWSRPVNQVARLAVIALIAATGFSTAALADARVRLDLGLRSMQGRAWEGMELQPSEGISIDYGRPDWPIELAFGLHSSEAEKTQSMFVPDGGGYCIIPFVLCFLTGETIERTVARSSLRELSVGVDKFWGGRSSRARGYIGGGPAFVKASISNVDSDLRDSDGSPGIWARAGILRVGPAHASVQYNWGLELRALQATSLRIGGMSADADYLQLGFQAGLCW